MRRGWKGTIAPARCVACQLPVHRGDSVTIRGGAGISHGGERHELSPGISALVLETSTWENEDSIFLVRLPDDVEVFVARHQLAPGVACTGKPPGDGSRG